MALNFTGRLQPGQPEPPPPRSSVFLLSCLGLAAALGGLVFALAVRQPRPVAPHGTPAPLATLIGVSEPSPPALPPAPVAVVPTPPPAPAVRSPAAAPPPPATPAKPESAAEAVRARMLAVLRRTPHATITLSVEDDPGAQAYARSLAELFRDAGWTVSTNAVFGSGPPMRGLSAALGSSPADDAVRAAFAAAQFTPGPPPAAALAEPPELFIGVPRADRAAAGQPQAR